MLSFLYFQTGREDDLKVTLERWAKAQPEDPWPVEFQKVLDMKGIRKVDQSPYTEYFKASAPQSSVNQLLSPSNSASTYGEESRIKKLENLIKKRL